MYPDLTIVMTTFFVMGDGGEREDAANLTLASWDKHLLYPGVVHLHIADDGSEYEYVPAWTRGKTSFSKQKRCGVGASLNKGFRRAFETSPFVFYGVDDWLLNANYDLAAWVRVFIEHENIGMIRLGPPHPNLQGTVRHLDEHNWGLELDRYSFAYGQRPALYHQRFYEAYGDFPENLKAVECERIYSERVNSMPGPCVLLALPHPWQHIYTTSLSDMEPK